MSQNVPNIDALTPKQELAALSLAAGRTIAEVADACQVSTRSVKRWLVLSSFGQRIRELRSEMVERALGRMSDGMAEAADTLRQLLSAESETVRLGACRAILELAVKLRESVELEQRLAAIEQNVSGGNVTKWQSPRTA